MSPFDRPDTCSALSSLAAASAPHGARRVRPAPRALGRRLLPVVALLLAACASGARIPVDARVIDLSHAYDANTIFWPTEEGFVLERGPAGRTEGGWYYAANRFRTAEHGGTHIDAPIHFGESRWTVDEIPLGRLMGEAVLVDVVAQCEADRDYEVSENDLREWERTHGEIPEGSIVLLRTGFGRHWPDRLRYMGTEERGADAVEKLHFPGLHPEAARFLDEKRRIHAVGIDTPSIDRGQSGSFKSHQILSVSNVPVFENLARLGELPTTGFLVIALPMKIRGGSGGPLRIVALLDPADRRPE